MTDSRKKELEDYQEVVESQLNLLESTPLTDGGVFPWSKGMVDEQLFLQNQLDIIEEELEALDEDETVHGSDIFKKISPKQMKAIIPTGHEDSDRTYVLGLCDEFLNEVSMRQYPYRFIVNYEWVTTKVDAYYMVHNIVVEYNNCTRHKQLPNDGTPVIVISNKDFGSSRKLKRDKDKDKKVISDILSEYQKIRQ
ncbi:MAG: hypothetical protein NC453_24960 [Muribaculum sp.]|nr:hypothetical protein [Muribaculum sp.]